MYITVYSIEMLNGMSVYITLYNTEMWGGRQMGGMKIVQNCYI